MRLILMSDTHGQHRQVKVPDGDVLVHAGDICHSLGVKDVYRDRANEAHLREFNAWLQALPHRHKIVIAGNHDFLFQRHKWRARGMIPNATYLEDASCTIDGVNFYGSPWQPASGWWAFNENRSKLGPVWAKIPSDTHVLITHGPPHGICDQTPQGEFAGCEALAKRVMELPLKLHVFGHIHSGRGERTIGETRFFNAAIVDMGYNVTNEPLVVDLDLG